MWVELICGLVLYQIVKRFFYEDDALADLDSSDSSALFTVAKRLEKLYHGSKVYIGLQIPDPDSGSRQNIDLVLVTNQDAVVICVKNVSGFVSTDKDGNWICTDGKHHKTVQITNPVSFLLSLSFFLSFFLSVDFLFIFHHVHGLEIQVPETKNLASILEEYLEQRGVALPEGYLSFKVICPNPSFSSVSDSFPPEVITYDQWSQLKPEQKNSYSGWIKGALLGGKKKMQESFCDNLNSVLSTAPILDRLELKGNKYILGEFIEFKGKQDDLQALRIIKRSKVTHSTVQLLYTPRDYRVEGPSWSSQWEEMTVRSSTEVVFQPQNSTKSRKYKLSSVISMSLSA
ncbi:hypothetical protein ACJIZ3_022538 [Penstemon smallii]|uniref:NERD domain-containing protein n=1 Tax=Penstemon smallii TaxID=265156 RepID=A0ABD3TLH8_9LAMI